MGIQLKQTTQCFIELGDLLYQVPVSDYSFSQSLNQVQINRNEMALNGSGYTNRSIATENESLNFGDWSVTVPVKYLKSTGSGTGKRSITANKHSAVEAPFWAMMATNETPTSYATVNLSDLPDYNQNVYTRAHFNSSAGGTGSSTNLFYSSATNFVDFYIVGVGKHQTVVQNYADDFEWTATAGSGGSAVPIPYGGAASSYGGHGSISLRQYVDDHYDTGPVFFLRSEALPITTNSTYKSAFLLSMYFPTGTTPGAFINTNGDITFTATAKHDAVLGGVVRRDLDSYWHLLFNQAQYEQLLTANMYFVTDTPTATVAAGTTNSRNTLIYETTGKHWKRGEYDHAVEQTPGFQTLTGYKPGQIQQTQPAFQFHGGEPAGIGLSRILFTQDFARANDIFPTTIVRRTTAGTHTFTVNQSNGAWTDESGDQYNAPVMRLNFQHGISQTAYTSTHKSVATIISGTTVQTSSETTGFREGDHLVLAAGTYGGATYVDIDGDTPADSGVTKTVPVEVRFVVTSVYSGFRDGLVRVFPRRTTSVKNYQYLYETTPGNKITLKEALGKFHPDWPAQNQLYIESIGRDGSVQSFTQTGSVAGDDVSINITATVDGTGASASNVLTLTTLQSTMITGLTLISDEILGNHAVFVVGVATTNPGSGDVTRVTLSDDVTITASTTVSFVGFPPSSTLLPDINTWRWVIVNDKAFILLRDGTNSEHKHNLARFKFYRSRASNIGGSTVFKLENCCTNSASINFDMGSTTEITFSGYTKDIHHDADNFTFASTAPGSPSANDIFYDTDNNQVQIRNAGNTAWVDCFTEGVDSTDNFVSNKMSRLTLTTLDQQETYENFLVDLSNFHATNAYNYEAGTSNQYYSGLSGTNGMSANVASIFINWNNYGYNPGGFAKQWVQNYDWSLKIDGTSYSTSSFLVGLGDWNKDNVHMISMRSQTAFGKFAILSSGSSNGSLLVFCTATNSTYNTNTKLNEADIQLIGTAKTSTPSTPQFSVPIIDGNITISNNLQMISKNELGKLNKPLSHITGPRSVSGSFTAYLDENTTQIRDNIKHQIDTLSFSDTVGGELYNRGYATPSQYKLELGIGNDGYKTSKSLSILLPTVSMDIPTTDAEDAFTTTMFFIATDTFYDIKSAERNNQANPNIEEGLMGTGMQLFYKG